MTRHIVVAIEPREDGVRCGECRGTHSSAYYCGWSEWHEIKVQKGERKRGEYTRGPACLAAEAKLAALIEAGGTLASAYIIDSRSHSSFVAAWDRAVEEVKK